MFPSVLRRASCARNNAPTKTKDIPPILKRALTPSPAEIQVRKILKQTVSESQKDIEKFLDLPGNARDQSALKGRTNLLWRIRTLISEHFGSSYTVDTFGSSKYGAASAKSDMDLIILDKSRPLGFDPMENKKLSKIYRMNILAGTLRKGGFLKVKAIPATVPIIKFEDKKTKIKCDLNVNDQPGYWNSVMIRRYTELSPHMIPLLKAIKFWAKPLGLNTPSPEVAKAPVTFSSYAYVLMTIAFMQRHCLLPNIQDNLDKIEEHSFWNRKPIYLCDLRFRSNAWPLPRNYEVDLMELMGDWFQFWGNFDPTQQIVDIRLGGILSRTSEPLELEPPQQKTPENLRAQCEIEAREILQELGVPGEYVNCHEYEDWNEFGDVDESDDLPNTLSVPGGEPYDPQALQRWESHTFCLVDPFIRVRNVAVNISSQVFEHFQAECRRAGAEMRRSSGNPIRKGVAM